MPDSNDLLLRNCVVYSHQIKKDILKLSLINRYKHKKLSYNVIKSIIHSYRISLTPSRYYNFYSLIVDTTNRTHGVMFSMDVYFYTIVCSITWKRMASYTLTVMCISFAFTTSTCLVLTTVKLSFNQHGITTLSRQWPS